MGDREDRGRVPFALVGVLLLVSSAMLSATGGQQPQTVEPDVERAIERADATTVTVLRRATRRAARDAARRPVTAGANTTVGRALGDSPFRESLRLRAYLAVRRDLRTVRTSTGDVTVRAHLPPVANDSTRAVRTVLDRVRLERAGPNGTALRVTVSNVTLVARRDGRTVQRVSRSPSVVIPSPVLVLHGRAETFESRADADPLDRGLGRRLTARLYALAWGRGLAQYGGAPVTNVVATRHVELLANGALLRTQRATLGATDPDGRVAVRERTAAVAAADLAGGAATRSPAVAALRRASDYADVVGAAGDDGRRGTTRVSAATAADGVFAAFTSHTRDRLDGILERVYTAEVHTEARTRVVDSERSGERRPSGGWRLVDSRSVTHRTVRRGDGPAPAVPNGWQPLGHTTREVVETRVMRRTWQRGNRTRETTRVHETTHAVGLVAYGRPTPETPAPPAPVPSAFDGTASPVGGPNLADVRRRVAGRLEGDHGDDLAVAAIDGGLDTEPRTVEGTYPPSLRRAVAEDLVALHREVRGTSVRVSTTDVGTLAVNPPARLATRLRARRAALLDAPERYGSVASKASVAVRVAYLDAVLARLESAAETHRRVRGRTNDVLAEAGVGDLGRLRRVAQARNRAVDPTAEKGRTLGGPLAVGVETAPTYLDVSAVERESAGFEGDGEIHPLETRNLNVFTLPYGDAADTAVGRLVSDRRVRLSAAARTLAATRAAANATGNATLERRQATLSVAINRSLVAVEGRLSRTLRRRGVGRGPAARDRILEASLDRWETPEARALAISNGSATRSLVRTVARRTAADPGPGFEAALNATVRRALADRSVRPRRRPTHRAANATRSVARRVLRDGANVAVEAGGNAAVGYVEGRLNRSLGAVPAGLPVVPVPGYWYATANVWHVTVRGEYGRLVVRSRRGRPPDGTLSYVRDGRGVRLDVDGDGDTELLGRSTRVSFDVSTTVVVVVPPGSRGVGDTGGDADERSPGWRESGTDSR